MDKDTRGILYGLALGDGYLYSAKNNFGVNYTQLKISHSPKQKDYIEYKANLILSLFGGKFPKIREVKWFNKTVQKEYSDLRIMKTHKYFEQMRRNLYDNKTKVITRKILDYLTDHGLALWYMDDGCGTICWNNRNGVKTVGGCMTRIATYCSLQEAEVIKQWFKDRYEIDIKFDCDKRSNKYSIRMNTKDSKKFVAIIKSFVIPSMLYKITHVETPHECLTPEKGDDIV